MSASECVLDESNELNHSLSRSYQAGLPLTPDAGLGHGAAGLRADADAGGRDGQVASRNDAARADSWPLVRKDAGGARCDGAVQPGAADTGGCSCQTQAGASPLGLFWLAIAALALGRRRRS